jgi:hypothetical protein
MKLTTTTFISLDGVMQGIGAPDEDRSGGFEHGGWTTPLWDNEAGTFLNQVYQRADAFLFGRRTYEIFAGSWGTVDDSDRQEDGDRMGHRPDRHRLADGPPWTRSWSRRAEHDPARSGRLDRAARADSQRIQPEVRGVVHSRRRARRPIQASWLLSHRVWPVRHRVGGRDGNGGRAAQVLLARRSRGSALWPTSDRSCEAPANILDTWEE